jgi:hypothetical protein
MVEPDGLPICINGVLSVTAAAMELEGFPVKEPEGYPKPAQPPPAADSHPAPPAQPVDLRELAAAQQGCPDCARGALPGPARHFSQARGQHPTGGHVVGSVEAAGARAVSLRHLHSGAQHCTPRRAGLPAADQQQNRVAQDGSRYQELV